MSYKSWISFFFLFLGFVSSVFSFQADLTIQQGFSDVVPKVAHQYQFMNLSL